VLHHLVLDGDNKEETIKHIILGAGGTVGQLLGCELVKQGQKPLLVSRSGHALTGTESVSADLTDLRSLESCVEPGSVVYLTVGLKYDRRIWETEWPRIMENCIHVSAEKNARLIFFDNVYLYGQADGPMTETSPVNPGSVKGEIRARVARQLTDAIQSKSVTALIARAADFYGPYAYGSSLPYLFVFDKLMTGKKPQCLIRSDRTHSYTYTGDCGRALYLLATRDDAFGQVWHLPTARPALTGGEFIQIASRQLKASSDFSVMKKWMIRMAGLFNVTVREVNEMLYQNEFDYQFDSSKFESAFGFQPTPYEQGIEETIAHLNQLHNA
jgi:nucleoside-diphosphate-sugar epimerase